MKSVITSVMRMVTGVMLGVAVLSLPALAQISAGGVTGTGGSPTIAFGDTQVNTTKVLNLTLTASSAVTFANPAVITSTLDGTPFSMVAGDDGCAGVTLASAGTCTIAVRYTPTAETSSATYIRLATTAPAGYPGLFVNLSGKGITGGASTAGTLSITPASPFTISASLSDIPTQILTLKATGGNVAIDSSRIAIPDQWAINNLCGDSVRPGYDCVIMLYPAVPGKAGTYQYKVVIQASDKAHILDVSLNVSDTSSGAQGVLSVTPTSLAFGTLRPGESVDKTVTISASGASVSFTGLDVPTGFSVVHSCGTLIPAGGTCTAAITFKPDKEVSYSGSAVINSSGQGAPHFVTLSGSGSASANQQSLLTVSPATLSFGTIRPGTKQTKNVTITASGTNVTIGDITPPSGYTVTHSCGTLIPAGGSCSASVTFAPTAKIPYNGSAIIEIVPDAMQFITLSGSGGDSSSSGVSGSSPLMTLDSAFLDFGNVSAGTSTQKEIRLDNRGGGTLNAFLSATGESYAVSGSCMSPSSITGTTATLSIAAGGACSLSVKFSAKSVGEQTGKLTFSGTGADGLSVRLKGVGTASNATSNLTGLLATPSALTFGSVSIGSSMTKTVILSKANGTKKPTIGAISVPSGYLYEHNCATTTANACTLNLIFAPTSAAKHDGLMIINDVDGESAMITLTGEGTAAAQMTARTRSVGASLDVTGQFAFTDGEAVSAGNLYVAVAYKDALYFMSNGQWTPYVPGQEPPAYTTADASRSELTILVNQDVSSMSGAVLYLGYGRNIDEVINKKQYAPVHVVD